MKRFRKFIDISILACYIVIIYSMLSVTPRMSAALYRIFGESLDFIVNTIFASIVLAVVYPLFRRLKGKGMAAHLGLITIFFTYLLLIIWLIPILVEKVHLLEYGLLSYLALRAFRDIRPQDMRYLTVVFILVIVGYFDEVIQKYLPNRVYDLRDVYLNVLSGLLGLSLTMLSK